MLADANSLITSAPAVFASRTASRSCSAVARPSGLPRPPVRSLSCRTEVRMRGPGMPPAARAWRRSRSRASPTLCTVVKPLMTVSRALSIPALSRSSGVSPVLSKRSFLPKCQPMWTWVSMNPGMSVNFDRSYVTVPGALPTAVILPSATVTTTLRCDPPRPSRRRPARIVMLAGACAFERRAAAMTIPGRNRVMVGMSGREPVRCAASRGSLRSAVAARRSLPSASVTGSRRSPGSASSRRGAPVRPSVARR